MTKTACLLAALAMLSASIIAVAESTAIRETADQKQAGVTDSLRRNKHAHIPARGWPENTRAAEPTGSVASEPNIAGGAAGIVTPAPDSSRLQGGGGGGSDRSVKKAVGMMTMTMTTSSSTTAGRPLLGAGAEEDTAAADQVGARIENDQHGSMKYSEDMTHSKVCLAPGPCFKKKLVCPKNCSKLPGEGGGRRLVKDHFPGQCVFNCKKCVAHC